MRVSIIHSVDGRLTPAGEAALAIRSPDGWQVWSDVRGWLPIKPDAVPFQLSSGRICRPIYAGAPIQHSDAEPDKIRGRLFEEGRENG